MKYLITTIFIFTTICGQPGNSLPVSQIQAESTTAPTHDSDLEFPDPPSPEDFKSSTAPAIIALGFGDVLPDLKKQGITNLNDGVDIENNYYNKMRTNKALMQGLAEEYLTWDTDSNEEDLENGDNDFNIEKNGMQQQETSPPSPHQDKESEYVMFTGKVDHGGDELPVVSDVIPLTVSDVGKLSKEMMYWGYCMKALKRSMVQRQLKLNKRRNSSSDPGNQNSPSSNAPSPVTIRPSQLLNFGLKCNSLIELIQEFGEEFMVKSPGKMELTPLNLYDYVEEPEKVTNSTVLAQKVAYHVKKLIIKTQKTIKQADLKLVDSKPTKKVEDAQNLDSSDFSIVETKETITFSGPFLTTLTHLSSGSSSFYGDLQRLMNVAEEKIASIKAENEAGGRDISAANCNPLFGDLSREFKVVIVLYGITFLLIIFYGALLYYRSKYCQDIYPVTLEDSFYPWYAPAPRWERILIKPQNGDYAMHM